MKVKVNSSGLSVPFDTVGCIAHDYGTGIVTFLSDGGFRVNLHKSHLVEIDGTTQIEVGSEWVDPWRHACTVLGVGDEEVFIKNHTMNREYTYKKDKFLAELKPKPKTVTMYFYKDKEGRISATDYDIKYSDYICKKEIEL